MKIGFRIAYDITGKAYFLEGQVEGDVAPRENIVSDLKVMDLPFGALDNVDKWHIEKGVFVVDEYLPEPMDFEQLYNDKLMADLIDDDVLYSEVL